MNMDSTSVYPPDHGKLQAASLQQTPLGVDIVSQFEPFQNEIKKLETEIVRLRAALELIAHHADAFMEGAGEPEFSQFDALANAARAALSK